MYTVRHLKDVIHMLYDMNKKGQVGNSPPPRSPNPTPFAPPPPVSSKTVNAEEKGENNFFKLFAEAMSGKKPKAPIGKHHYLLAIIIIIFIALIIAFFYSLSVSHSGIFSYQAEFVYGPYVSAIGNILSPITSLTAQVSCLFGGFTGGSNIYNCFYSAPKPVVNNNNGFTAFVTIGTPANEQQLEVSPSGSLQYSLQYIYYTIKNVGQVPLGASYQNNLLVSFSCQGTIQPNICNNYTNPTPVNPNTPLFTPHAFQNVLFPGQQYTNASNVIISCPSVKGLRPPAPVQLNIVANVTGYPAATIFPIVIANKDYVRLLAQSQQSFYAQQPAEDFVSPGPVEIVANYQGGMPILNSTKAIPITVQMTNSGTGSVTINSFSVFFNKTDFSPASTVLQVGGYIISSSDCKPAQGGKVLNFQLPPLSYYNCTVPSDYFKNGINTGMTLDIQINSFDPNFHFNTLPILFYVNYNYVQTQGDTLQITNSTVGCSSG